ncbi:XdhC family protein [Pseudomonas sp. S75]|uniref:XdhC family protein n=1 Tax=unclassified Pseudomonas TaxID=196821 RepID=UPI001DD2D8FA|nr:MULTISPECIES: XdhC family protein [unclassified Pseudomonas]MBJ9974137.1 XdhC family protein [Pseudomonas sp. S30]MBK0151933.1 XdhC family protein [Pseudomonas sp. S75]
MTASFPHHLTDDPISIIRFAADALERGFQAAIVTLVEVRGSSSRSSGAMMAVRGDGNYVGFVSGGCVEAAAAAEALEAMGEGRDRDIRYGQGSPYFDIVLPCGGGITLAIHVLRSLEPLQTALAALDARRPVALVYQPRRESLDCVEQVAGTGWHENRFITVIRPPICLVIYGRSIEVEALSRLARAVGFEVHAYSTCDEDVAQQLIDADTALAVLFHDPDLEMPALRAGLASAPFYFGALGSSRAHQRRGETLRRLGYSSEDVARIKAPIGLFARARDSSSLALSILADIAAARSIEWSASVARTDR